LLSKNSIVNFKQLRKGSAGKQAVLVLNNPKLEIYTAIENSLQTFMFKKWRLKRAQFNKTEILEILNNKKVDELVIAHFNQIIESCEMARFTSAQSLNNEQDLKQQTVKLIKHLDNY
jgi:folate-dependent phosphoribosylglycinamide formyltransferase PurN